jgi:hypothetical protein
MLDKLFVIGVFLLLSAMAVPAQNPPPDEIAIWNAAVSHRQQSFTLAPGELPYEQYQLERSGDIAHKETGIMRLSYNDQGKADIGIIWARRDDKDFTQERAQRLEKQADRRNEFLSLTTPFDPDVQSILKRQPGKRIYAEGIFLWEYDFELPQGEHPSIVGTARVRDDTGKPYDLSYSFKPLPWFLDLIEMHLVFDTDSEFLEFHKLDYRYEASFLFFLWRGGGEAFFGNWLRLSVPPRLN